MKYNAPYGSLDPDAHYVDRRTPDAVQGSKVPAKAIENPQREIVAVIAAAGLTPDDGDTTQLLQALQFYFSQFPIFPECLNGNGTFDVSQPSAGTIRVPAGVGWVMRGATHYTTVQTDLTTLSSKTYHLRWDKANGFRLRDLADLTYNPTAAAEDNAGFDSTYDDMLVARVVTNGANVATITNLINRDRLRRKRVWSNSVAQALDWTTFTGTDDTLNWARTPISPVVALKGFRSHNHGANGAAHTPSDGKILAIEARFFGDADATRYGYAALQYYYEDDAGNSGWLSVVVTTEA